jgi:hypothetical protein
VVNKESKTLEFRRDIEWKYFPEKHKDIFRKYDHKAILKIQAHFRRHQIQQKFQLMIEKARTSPNRILIKKWPQIKGNCLFIISTFYLKDANQLLFKPFSREYTGQVEEFTIKISEIDRHNFEDKLSNVKRFADMIEPYVKLEDVHINRFRSP